LQCIAKQGKDYYFIKLFLIAWFCTEMHREARQCSAELRKAKRSEDYYFIKLFPTPGGAAQRCAK
jgi:hypothetical protein